MTCWSRFRNWFTAPFAPRVEQRVPVARQRVPSTHLTINVPVSTQAREFLLWVQEDPSRTGAHAPCYLMALYKYFCQQRDWKPHYWQRVGHELSLLIGEGSKVEWVDGKKQRMWHIPKRVPQRVVPAVAASHQRVLGHMATRVEAA